MASEWSCDWEAVQMPTTVGQELLLNCSGSQEGFGIAKGEPIQTSKWQVQISGDLPEQYKKFALKILDVEKISDQNVKLHVTSYLAAKHNFKNMQITDGQGVALLSVPQLEVASVLQPPTQGESAQPAQQPTPYPAYGPVKLSVPVLYWLLLLTILVAAGYFIYRRFKKVMQKRKLISDLDQYKTVASAFDQFHKELRMLEKLYPVSKNKDLEYTKELNRIFSLYLIRELKVPAFEWSAADIFAEIQSQNKVLGEYLGKEFLIFLKEIQKGAKESKMTHEDCQVILDHARKQSERIHQFFNSKKEPGRRR